MHLRGSIFRILLSWARKGTSLPGPGPYSWTILSIWASYIWHKNIQNLVPPFWNHLNTPNVIYLYCHIFCHFVKSLIKLEILFWRDDDKQFSLHTYLKHHRTSKTSAQLNKTSHGHLKHHKCFNPNPAEVSGGTIDRGGGIFVLH